MYPLRFFLYKHLKIVVEHQNAISLNQYKIEKNGNHFFRTEFHQLSNGIFNVDPTDKQKLKKKTI